MTILASLITYNSKEGCPVQSKFSPQTVSSYQQYTIWFFNSNWLGVECPILEKIGDLPKNLQMKQAYKMYQYAKKLQKH